MGGAVGAVGAIVLGYGQQPLVLAGAAFAGSLLATLAAWALGRKAPGSAGILLAGIAINAFGGAMLGVFTYMATDDQLRSLTFWNLGSLGTAAQTACPAFCRQAVPAFRAYPLHEFIAANTPQEPLNL